MAETNTAKSPLPTPSIGGVARGPIIAAWLFPVLLWGVATLYLGGALGKNCDDYSINMRDVVSDELPTPFNPFVHFPYFIRPLHHVLLFGGMTLWSGADRGVHIALALCHALACVGVWRMMREFTQTRVAAAAAALVFMVMPWHGEAAFWYSTISTSIGVALFSGIALLAMKFCRAPTHRWGLLGAIAVLGLVVPCFYEQSIAPAAALPLMGVAVASGPLVRRMARAALATIAAGIGPVVYVVLMRMTAPQTARGGANSFVTKERVWVKLDETVRGVKYNLIGDRAYDVLAGSVKLGWETVASPKGLVVGSVLLAGAVLWAVWATRKGGESGEVAVGSQWGRWRGAWLVPIGAAVFFAGFVPVYVIDRQIVELRNLYVPLVGAAMVLAGVLDVLMVALAMPHRACGSVGRALAATATIAAVSLGATGMVGFQKLYRNRSERDLREMAQLQELVPNPPPGTVFAPFRTRSKGAETGHTRFDRGLHGVFETPWSAPALLLRAYRRADIGVTSSSPWAPLALDKVDATGVRWKGKFGFPLEADPDGGVRIPWDSMVPFVIDARPDARVRLICEITVEMPDHRDLVIRPPLVQQVLAAKPDLPTATYHLRGGDIESRLDIIPLKFWEYADGSPVAFKPMWIWAGGEEGGGAAKPRETAWLAAYYQKFASMSISMPPRDRPERLMLRATIAEYDLDPAKHELAFVEELVVTMASAPGTELGVLRLDPREMKRWRRWVPLVVTITPRLAEAGDRIVVTLRHAKEAPVRLNLGDKTPVPAGAGGAAILPIWVTHGYTEAIPIEPNGDSGGK